MKAWLRHLSDSLNFTPTERAVVLTLVGAFLLGLGIRLFRNEPTSPAFDYAATDAEFAARSAAQIPAAGGNADRTADAGRESIPAAPRGGDAASENVASPAGLSARVDLNRATKRDLMSLPGIGEVIAERILLYREEHGAFAAVGDLQKVRGIGKKKLDLIAPYCFVEN